MRFTLEAFGRRIKVSVAVTPPPPQPQWEPTPSGSTCGDLSRAEAWDHDKRSPVGFAPSATEQKEGI